MLCCPARDGLREALSIWLPNHEVRYLNACWEGEQVGPPCHSEAGEDIGLAEPQALAVAVAAQQAVHFLGMPEGRIPLAEATVYLATAPKSNSAYAALERALDDVKRLPNDPVPLHLRNAVTGLMRQMGYGKDYKYSHDYEGHFADQDFLPSSLKGRRYYQPSEEGSEEEIGRRLESWWGKPGEGPDNNGPHSSEE